MGVYRGKPKGGGASLTVKFAAATCDTRAVEVCYTLLPDILLVMGLLLRQCLFETKGNVSVDTHTHT